MAFDLKYYQEKKDKLFKKRELTINQHLESDIRFGDEVKDILKEIQDIEIWEKENVSKEELKTKEVKTPKV